jgi:hypothetical protein
VSSVSTCSRVHSSVCTQEQRNQDESKQPDSRETRRRTYHGCNNIITITETTSLLSSSHRTESVFAHYLTSKRHLTSLRTARHSQARPPTSLTSLPPTFDKRHKPYGYSEEHAGSMRRAFMSSIASAMFGTYFCGYDGKRIRGCLSPRKG